MTYVNTIVSQFRAWVSARNISKSALANKAGLAPNTLKKFWEDDWNPSLDTLKKLEQVMADEGGSTGQPSITASTIPALMGNLPLSGKRVLLIVTGGIAAYKSLDLIRRLQDEGAIVTGVMTKGAQEFITPLSVASLSGNQCYMDLFDLKEESEMGHIKLSRDNDLVLVAPATADMMAKMVSGLANDLASTLLLATDKPVMIAPAMNSQMWAHPATQRNIATLKSDGIHFVNPASGLLACGEVGPGKLADVMDIVAAVKSFFAPKDQPLKGKRVVMTAGPTHEPIDPVRYIANRSSGKQGYALASALAAKGADVTLVSGPTNIPAPEGVTFVQIESAIEMKNAVEHALPADIAIFVAAVADWRTSGRADQKMKKEKGGLPNLTLAENPDILATISQLTDNRPEFVIGFAAETEKVIEHASAKRLRKGCDWIIANDVSHTNNNGVMGGDFNQVHVIKPDAVTSLPEAGKSEVATMIVKEIIDHYADK